MTSIIVQLAEALKTALNAAVEADAFSMEFAAERYYAPSFNLKDMGTLHVSIVPKSSDESRLTRGGLSDELQIDVSIQKKPETATKEEIDALMDFVKEVSEFIRTAANLTLTDGTAKWQRAKNEPIYSPEHLKQFGLFTSLLTVTFTLSRSA